MLPQIKLLILLPVLLFCKPSAHAQDTDYLKHGKFFCICSFKKECFDCYACDKERYKVKIYNKTDKKIKKVFYGFYSEVFNRVLEKEAKLEGNRIDNLQSGVVHVCVPDGKHWVITEVDYEDGTSNKFVLHDRMSNFIQEADECDCND